MFFIIGPLRTGSSLLTRCIDDHPGAICLCESEINRVVFPDYSVSLYFRRMRWHGLESIKLLELLDRRKQDEIKSVMKWYGAVHPVLAELYQKPGDSLLGDKSPDFYRAPELVEYLAANFPLIYTIRDPRAIFASIDVQEDANIDEKVERWGFLLDNYRVWKPYLEAENVLIVRYEDLIRDPWTTMRNVYGHIGLPDSARFMERFPRLYPERFLWTTAIDWETGLSKEFDPRRISSWKSILTLEQVEMLTADETVAEIMDRFGYDARGVSAAGPALPASTPAMAFSQSFEGTP